MAPGCLLSGWLMERLGRRNAHYVVCALFLLGWLLLASADGLGALLAGRALTGLCTGLLGPLGPVFLAETAAPRLRALLLAAVSLAIAVGILVAHLLGTFLSWRWTASLACLVPALAALPLALVPESPTWLLARGRREDAVRAFLWLRGHGAEARAELRALLAAAGAAGEGEGEGEEARGWREALRELRRGAFLRPLLVMVVFFATCQFSGVNAVAFYSVDIVERAAGAGLDRYAGMLAVDALRVLMSGAACVLCRRVGRRPLCMASGALAAGSLAALAACTRWQTALAGRAWLPLGCLLVYISAVSVGLVPLPWMMCGEVFGRRARGLGSGVSSAVAFASFFLVVKSAPGLMERLGAPLLFLCWGAVAALGTALLYCILPETRGKSLQEIEEHFTRTRRVDPKV